MPQASLPVPAPPDHVLLPAAASACAKAILCGEHAVVYGHPAIALPVPQVRALARVAASAGPAYVTAGDLGDGCTLADPEPFPALLPLQRAIQLGCRAVGWTEPPPLHFLVESGIPIAAGLGSGAATSVALLRAIAVMSGRELDAATLSALAFEVEKLHHGTPSGVDNTVIAYERPLYFTRAAGMGPLVIREPLALLIADSGVRSSTRAMVGGVREAREADPARFDGCFVEIGALVEQARAGLAAGDLPRVGALLTRNHELLQAIGVSSTRLDELVETALGAGAWGAKLSGAGGGGVVIALAAPERSAAIAAAWRDRAGVQGVFEAEIPATGDG